MNVRDLPLSFAQERLWFLEQLEPGTPVYNIPWAVRLSGDLKVNALEQALDWIIARHEVLRTTYKAVDGVPQQVIHPPASVEMNVVDLRHLPLEKRESTAQQRLDDAARRPFDLTSDLMLRATLIRLADDQQILLLVAHHIASDGWSHEILVRELSDLYTALSHDEEPKLPPLPMQYADYALWQRERLTGDVLKRELAYWKEQLADLPPALNLPFDRPRGPRPDYGGGRVPIEIPDQVTQGLRRLAREEKSTLFMVLLAGFMTLLYRYTGKEDIAVGIPIAGRLRTDTENLIGFFVNTLVLRGDLSHEPTFRELLHRVRNVCLDAYDHQELPFEKLVAELRPERHLSQSPLFQVMFAMHSITKEGTRLADLGMKHSPVQTQTAKFDLSIDLEETPARIKGSMMFPIVLFDTERVTRTIGNFRRLLDAISANPDRQVSRIPIMTDEERYLITRKWNETRAEYPKDQCVHNLFEEQVSRTPDAPAVTFGDETLTYRELNRRTNLFGHRLRRMGVGPDIPVGLCVERSIEMLVGILAILKAGGAYVPLDPALPLERLQFMSTDADLRLTLTQARLIPKVSLLPAELLCIDDAQVLANEDDQQNPSPTASPDNLAYIIYTSGSTGSPKGVLINHCSVITRLSFFGSVFGLRNDDVVLQIAPFAFDMSIRDLICPVTIGAHIILASSAEVRDPFLLVKKIDKHGVTAFGSTPSFLSSIVDAIKRTDGDHRSLRRIFSGGEALPSDLAQRILETFGGRVRLSNGYGPTECTMTSTQYEIRRMPLHGLTVPIGRPLPSTEIYILDRYLQPVPIGIPGELYIGGLGLARGYLNRPSLTKEKFIPNPFSDEVESRLYKTGDLARYLPDGNIEFLGRLDRQVKIRGHRIELREIELAIESHPLVKSCHASTSTLAEGDVQLVAYVVCTGDKQNIKTTLRQYLQQRLPGYMLPAALVSLDALPLLPSGKVDRQALPLPEWSRGSSLERFVPPTTETEKKLARIWEEVLKLDRVGITDSFFELGGHSLLAVRLINQIEDLIGVRLPVAQFFENPTIGAISALVRPRRHTEEEPYVLHVQPEGKRRPFFCMADAEYMFAMAKALGPEQPFYGMRIPGLGEEEIPLDTIEAMASYCVRAIERIDPRGPYLIGGHCFGGIVAFEVAQQLTGKGKAVDLLVMLDPGSLVRRRRKLIRFWMYRLWYDVKRRRVMEAIHNRLEALGSILASIWKRGPYLKLKRYNDARLSARGKYELSPYSGRVLFIWSSEPVAPPSAYKEQIRQTNPWLKAARGDVRELTIEGTHTGIFREPGLRRLVEELRSELGAGERAKGTERA